MPARRDAHQGHLGQDPFGIAGAGRGQRRRHHGASFAHEQRTALAGGSEFTHGILNSSRNTVAYGGESDFAFAAGDAIRTDYVTYVKGYPGHQSRCAVVGRATERQKSEYAIARDVYLASCDQLKPGRTAGEVYDFVVKKFASVGTPTTWSGAPSPLRFRLLPQPNSAMS